MNGVMTTTETIIPLIAHFMKGHPRQAAIWHIRLNADQSPNLADVQAIAPKVVVIRIKLSQQASA
jgi:hypothetical protein